MRGPSPADYLKSARPFFNIFKKNAAQFAAKTRKRVLTRFSKIRLFAIFYASLAVRPSSSENTFSSAFTAAAFMPSDFA